MNCSLFRRRRLIRATRDRDEICWTLFSLVLVHEFFWMFFQNYPAGTTGAVEAITRFPMIAYVALLLSLQRPLDRFLILICCAMSLTSFIVALCEFMWLVDPWSSTSSDSCSLRVGISLPGVSAIILIGVFLFRKKISRA